MRTYGTCRDDDCSCFSCKQQHSSQTMQKQAGDGCILDVSEGGGFRWPHILPIAQTNAPGTVANQLIWLDSGIGGLPYRLRRHPWALQWFYGGGEEYCRPAASA
jgi:hypothetical protein